MVHIAYSRNFHTKWDMGQPNLNDFEADFFLSEKHFFSRFVFLFLALFISLVLNSYIFPVLENQSATRTKNSENILYILPWVATGVAVQVPTCYPHFLYF